jgi:hypothetical protein
MIPLIPQRGRMGCGVRMIEQKGLFPYVNLEDRISTKHPLRVIPREPQDLLRV